MTALLILFQYAGHGFTKFTAEQIEQVTRKSGLKIERIIEIEPQESICVIARKEIIIHQSNEEKYE